MSTEFLRLAGAVEGGGADAGVAAHYGNPLVEQRTLAAGEAVVDLSHRAVLTVTGEDRLTWLHNITTQHVLGFAPGECAETLVLSQTGRVEHAMHLIEDGEVAWLIVEREGAEALREWLDSMRFMMRVEVADRSDDYAVVGGFGELGERGAAEADGGLALEPASPHGTPLVWRDPWRAVVNGGYQYAGAQHPGEEWTWRELIIERSRLGEAARLPAAGILAFEALRIAAWRPRFGAEVDDKAIPHELDWMRSAVHLTKGCYRGQETVAKVHNLGHPPRRLVMLHLDGSEGVLPAPGDEVVGEVRGEARAVGHVTSSALHYELGPIALALVRRMTDPDASLVVSSGGAEIAATQEVIVPPDAGSVANVPRLPRLGGAR